MERIVARVALVGSGLLIVVALIAAAAAFLCVAIDRLLQVWLTPPLAAFATAVAILAAGLLIALIVVLLVRRRRAGDEPFAVRLNRELTSLAGEHTAAAVTVALLVGFAVGAVPPLRAALKDRLAK